MMRKQLYKRLLFALFLSSALSLAAADVRKEPVDFFLILDLSTIKNNRQEAVNWVCNTVIDGMIQDGDRLSVWYASDKAELVFSDTITGAQREAAKRQIRNLPNSGGGSLSTVLREAERRVSALPAQRLAYALLVGGVGLNQGSSQNGVGDLLRYAKSKDFSGWKAIVVGFGIDSRVNGAALSYIDSKK